MVDKPSQAQLKLINDLGYTGKPPYSLKDASELISKLITIRDAKKLKETVNYSPPDEDLKELDKLIGMYATCLTKCVDVDITNPAVIGMILNNWRQVLTEKNK